MIYNHFISTSLLHAIQYTIAMMGYDDEYKTTVVELTYNYGVTEYTKGNAYAQVGCYLDYILSLYEIPFKCFSDAWNIVF